RVRVRLAGYLDDAIESPARSRERFEMRAHLESCAVCREELQRYRKLAVLLSRAPRVTPPANLAVRIKVAAAQVQHTLDPRTRWRRFRGRAEIPLGNGFRPLTVPAPDAFLSPLLIFLPLL